jgi:lipopolysaccharide export system permease protein
MARPPAEVRLMGGTLGRYVGRIFAGQLLLVLLSAAALLQLFDLMSNIDGVIEDLGGGPGAMLRYTLLRLPTLLTFLLPFSVLIAAIMTLGRLHRHSELVAFQAIGLAFPRILLMFAPVVAVAAVAHFLINDQLTPRTSRMLDQWQASADPEAAGTPVWLKDGADLISIGSVRDQGLELVDIVIFRRDQAGNLEAQLSAGRAVFENGGWTLGRVDRMQILPAAEHRIDPPGADRWEPALDPTLLEDMAAPPTELSLGRLSALLQSGDTGSRPPHVYRTWLQKNLALPFSSFFMVVLAAASVRSLQRQGGMVLNALIGFGGAFLYFVADGVLLAFGEAGTVPPAVAAWAPLLVLTAVAGGVLYWITRPRGRRRAKNRYVAEPAEPA